MDTETFIRRGRTMPLDEATRVLNETRAQSRDRMVSWFTPHFETILNHTIDLKNKTVVVGMGAYRFNVRRTKNPDVVYLTPTDGFVPCGTLSISAMERAVKHGIAY